MKMTSLFLTLCFAGNCYVTAPVKFDTMADCKAAVGELVQSKQIQPAALQCKKK